MKRPYQIVGIVFILLAAFITRESLRLRFYTELGPGPGFFPFWLSLLLGLLGVIMFWQATFRRTDPMPEDFFASRVGYKRMGAIIVALMLFAGLMEILGYRITSLAFLLFLLFGLGRSKLLIAVPVALGGSFGVFYVFNDLLQVPLPMGILGF